MVIVIYWSIQISLLTIEALKQGEKYFQRKPERHKNHTNGVVLLSLLLTLDIFHTLL